MKPSLHTHGGGSWHAAQHGSRTRSRNASPVRRGTGHVAAFLVPLAMKGLVTPQMRPTTIGSSNAATVGIQYLGHNQSACMHATPSGWRQGSALSRRSEHRYLLAHSSHVKPIGDTQFSSQEVRSGDGCWCSITMDQKRLQTDSLCSHRDTAIEGQLKSDEEEQPECAMLS